MSKLEEKIKACMDANLPAIVWGAPGIGKSSVIRQIAEDKGIALIDIRLSQLSPVDLRGVPVPNHDTDLTAWYPPEELPNAERDGEEGILFLDELMQAPRDVQSAAMQLILDRKLGRYELPPKWHIISASNRTTDRAGTYQIISPLANRVVHITASCTLPALDMDGTGITVQSDDWKDWALNNGIDETVISFINYRPDYLWKTTGEVAFPTPRTWEYVSKITKVAGLDFDLISGCIGSGPATEFTAFARCRKDMPDPDDILAGKPVNVPKAPDVLYMLMGSLTAKLSSMPSKSTTEALKNLFAFIPNVPTEFQVLLVKDLSRVKELRRKLFGTTAFEEWASKHEGVWC